MDITTFVFNSFNGTKESETEITQHNKFFVLNIWVGGLAEVSNIKPHLRGMCVLKRTNGKKYLQ